MLDCLPSPEDWSPASQYLMLREHLEALRHHLEALEVAANQSAAHLVQESPHLQEINHRSLEAHDILKALAKQPESILSELTMEDN